MIDHKSACMHYIQLNKEAQNDEHETMNKKKLKNRRRIKYL